MGRDVMKTLSFSVEGVGDKLPNFLNYILRYLKVLFYHKYIQVRQVFLSKKYNQTTMRGHGNAFPTLSS
jgi:hypothetical protein